MHEWAGELERAVTPEFGPVHWEFADAVEETAEGVVVTQAGSGERKELDAFATEWPLNQVMTSRRTSQ